VRAAALARVLSLIICHALEYTFSGFSFRFQRGKNYFSASYFFFLLPNFRRFFCHGGVAAVDNF
jgi:hypothetical protein